jgi:hypothetical protein
MGEMHEMIQSEDLRGLDLPRLYTSGAEKKTIAIGKNAFCRFAKFDAVK